MRLRQRIYKSEKVIPIKSKQKASELEPRFLWLIKNDEEFKECLKQLWRLKIKAEQDSYKWEQLPEPYQRQAVIIQTRMNQIYERHKGED